MRNILIRTTMAKLAHKMKVTLGTGGICWWNVARCPAEMVGKVRFVCDGKVVAEGKYLLNDPVGRRVYFRALSTLRKPLKPKRMPPTRGWCYE